MTKREVLKQTRRYVADLMADQNPDTHGIRHVERVSKWALKIGRAEGGVDLFLLEIVALLHDIGRAFDKSGQNHCELGAEAARPYLESLDFFQGFEIDAICLAIREHGPGGPSQLTKILQDADRMDLWGASVIARVFSDWPEKAYYHNKNSFRYQKLTPAQIHAKCTGQLPELSVLDKLNTLLNIYEQVNTKTAQRLAREKIAYTKQFIKQLRKETIDL